MIEFSISVIYFHACMMYVYYLLNIYFLIFFFFKYVLNKYAIIYFLRLP